ncbi:MAG: type II secretory pathway, prepilin signal peptidase PulO [uncultured bacterium]|nr:MAG: type II secretory pathway, prepilin signal peptidase PulO [uncultured bacterium]
MNVVVLRLNAKKSLGGRSACPQCHNTLPWYTLIPVFSYIALGGKCAFCKHTIAIYYPLVELAMGVLFFVLTIWFIDQPIQLIVYASVVALCVGIFLSDYLFYTIPDALTVPGIIIALLGQIMLGEPWWSIGLGVIVGGGVFALQYLLSRGRWVGSGDIRLGLMMGAILAWPNIVVGLFLAYVFGGIAVLPLLLRHTKGMKDQVPFGTFLTVATIVTVLFGDVLVQWYLYEVGLYPG